jgi:hypothetical protein
MRKFLPADARPAFRRNDSTGGHAEVSSRDSRGRRTSRRRFDLPDSSMPVYGRTAANCAGSGSGRAGVRPKRLTRPFVPVTRQVAAEDSPMRGGAQIGKEFSVELLDSCLIELRQRLAQNLWSRASVPSLKRKYSII